MKKIKLIYTLAFMLAMTGMAEAQKNQPSPPASASGTIGDAQVEVKYHAPSVRGRQIFGGLEAYGEVWRTGANNATTISFSSDVTVEGKPLAAGTYSLFTIPGESEWVVIFNKVPEQWGAFNYDQAEDALRVTVKPEKVDLVETFKIDVVSDGVTMAWENTKVKFNVK